MRHPRRQLPGFDRAIVTILDANITTLIVAIFFTPLARGQSKGSQSPCQGIVTSMFSSIMGTRALINLIYGRRVKKLAIGGVSRVAATAEERWMKALPFMKWRWVAIAFSAAAMLAAIGSLSVQQLVGLDFTGGTLVGVAYSDSADLGAIRKRWIRKATTVRS